MILTRDEVKLVEPITINELASSSKWHNNKVDLKLKSIRLKGPSFEDVSEPRQIKTNFLEFNLNTNESIQDQVGTTLILCSGFNTPFYLWNDEGELNLMNSQFYFDELCKQLIADYTNISRIIVIEPPGYGKNPARESYHTDPSEEAYAKVIEELAIRELDDNRRLIIYGHSRGGRVVADVAGRNKLGSSESVSYILSAAGLELQLPVQVIAEKAGKVIEGFRKKITTLAFDKLMEFAGLNQNKFPPPHVLLSQGTQVCSSAESHLSKLINNTTQQIYAIIAKQDSVVKFAGILEKLKGVIPQENVVQVNSGHSLERDPKNIRNSVLPLIERVVNSFGEIVTLRRSKEGAYIGLRRDRGPDQLVLAR